MPSAADSLVGPVDRALMIEELLDVDGQAVLVPDERFLGRVLAAELVLGAVAKVLNGLVACVPGHG